MKIERLVSIIMILLDKQRINAHELAVQFEVSPRTIYRDIDTITMAGIPVRATAGSGGGFEIMPEYKIDKNVFSAADLSTILTALSSLSNMITGEELVHTLAKIKSFIPADKAQDIALKANQICIDLTPWMGNSNVHPSLEMIQTALAQKRLLTFTYTDRHGNKMERTAEPYQIVLKGSHWYWQGYCYKRNDFRLFKLSRTTKLHMEDTVFTLREHQKPQLAFDDILTTLQTTITLRIHKSAMDRMLDYCPYEAFQPDGEDHYLVSFPFIGNDYFYNILFSFGNTCECLEPMAIRAEMKRRIQDIAALYS